MIEPEAVIDPEAAPPARRHRQRRRAIVAGATLLAVVAGGFAITIGGGPEAEPLALMAADGAGAATETMSAGAGAAAPVAPALGSADARSALPYGWGTKFEVVGQLPALPDHAAAWDANSPDLDRSAMVRIAEALGVTGTPVRRDGGWFVDSAEWTLSAFGGDHLGKGRVWSINLYRSRYDDRPDGATAAADSAAGPAISGAEAEQRVRDLLARMGAPRASWKVEVTDTEIGVGWACAAPGMNPEELRKLEAEKLSQIERENAASNGTTTAVAPAPPAGSGAGSSGSAGATPAGKPAPDRGAAPCPPPPPPVKGFNVGLYPLLDGRRADWPVWNVTMRSDGRLENLYGSWVNFDRGGDYKLRGVAAALKDLQSPPGVPYAAGSPVAIEPAMDPPATAPGATPAADAAAGSSVSGRRPLRGEVASAPAVDRPADAPVCPMPMPMPMAMAVEDAKATSAVAAGCVAPAPQVIKITGVELGLIQTSVFDDGKVRMALVPSYRFTGHFENGEPWETSMLALHPSAIAPPPDFSVDGDGVPAGGGTTGHVGGGTTGDAGAGVARSIPPTPSAEPAVARDAD